MYDNGEEASERLLIFASPEQLRQIAVEKQWFMDGTFDAAPRLFRQLNVIRAAVGTTAIFCVLNCLQVSHYCRMLDGLAFLPVDQVQDAIRHLRTVVPDVVESDKLESLLDYFDSTYVSGTARRIQRPGDAETSIRIRRTPALFPPAI